MAVPQNSAAWLAETGASLHVAEAPLPTAGKGELVVRNRAVAVNPLDWHMQDSGVFVKQWPTIFGCDIAGEVYEVGPEVDKFKVGDRIIGHPINLVTGTPAEGAYALYTLVRANKAAILPPDISFTEGVVVPFALEAAVCALCMQKPGPCMPGVETPALGLPYPKLQAPAEPLNKTLIVFGASSSVGSMTTQIASVIGVHVIGIAGAHNQKLVRECGATAVLDHKDEALKEKAVDAVKATGSEFVGIFDAISTPDTYESCVSILNQLGGGHLACVHPPPTENIPPTIKTGMIFAVNDVATPVWKHFVSAALQSGVLKCLPRPTMVGSKLEHVNEALKKSKAGVSGTKLVIEL